MKKFLIPSTLATAAAIGTTRRFQREMADARTRVASVPRAVLDTSAGALEYADIGEGDPPSS